MRLDAGQIEVMDDAMADVLRAKSGSERLRIVDDLFRSARRLVAAGKIDVMVPKDTPFNRSRLARRLRVRPDAGYEAWFGSPEDVIVKKMGFYREGGWRSISATSPAS